MKERVDKKILASCLAFVVLLLGIICGTLAFLQDRTDLIENEFTYGDIDISLTEAVVDEYGVAADPTVRTDQDQYYKLIPGHSYTKDPTVTVAADSEPAYIYLLVDNPISALEDSNGTIASQIGVYGWTELQPGQGDSLYANGTALSGTQTIYYKQVDSDDEDQELPSFYWLNIAADADVSLAAGTSIDVTAFAVQSDGFATPLAAWEATFGQNYGGGSFVYEAFYDYGNDQATFVGFPSDAVLDTHSLSWSDSGVSAHITNVYTVNTEEWQNDLVIEFDNTFAGAYDGRYLEGTVSSNSETFDIVLNVSEGSIVPAYDAEFSITPDYPMAFVSCGEGFQLAFIPDTSTLTWDSPNFYSAISAELDGDNNLWVSVSPEFIEDSTNWGHAAIGSISDAGETNTATIIVYFNGPSPVVGYANQQYQQAELNFGGMFGFLPDVTTLRWDEDYSDAIRNVQTQGSVGEILVVEFTPGYFDDPSHNGASFTGTVSDINDNTKTREIQVYIDDSYQL